MGSKRVLVMGAAGMLGHAVLRWFAAQASYEVTGTLRTSQFEAELRERCPRATLISGVDASSLSALRQLFDATSPEVVINCVGVVKQLVGADSPAIAIPINAVLPHRLSSLCAASGARLIHISTDCVFSGQQGNYDEDDLADAEDLYGRSKLMGEVEAPHAVTLRTSIIGHELSSTHALLGWFLSQRGEVPGYSNAIFSALPTVELARVIDQFVLSQTDLSGVFHVAGPTINKYELLKLVAQVYQRDNVVHPEPALVIDRSLNGEKFGQATGYQSAPWQELLQQMRAFG
jgi:dTDP-4-dehydrorhamnose reductase